MILPAVFTTVLIVISVMLIKTSKDKYREISVCEKEAESLIPYLAEVKAYRAIEADLHANMTNSALTSLLFELRAAEKNSTAKDSIDGWKTVNKEYSWDKIDMKKGFFVLSEFTSPDVNSWRIAALDLTALDCDNTSSMVTNLSLSITMESAIPAN